MAQIVGIRFKSVGKIYYFNPAKFELKKGMSVIVETARGLEIGEVVVCPHEVPDKDITKPLKGILRIANDEDFKRREENKKNEARAFEICVEKIKQHNLEMKLVEVEYTFDASKILFYFTADGRVDFRDLVKDLANVFRTRIELRQIGVRDQSKTIGSIGVCGRSLCCSQFLGEFEPVSIKMAKEQGLSLNPSKISGACGRLMCCLKYEQSTYEELLKITPRQGALVDTPEGKGIVEYVNILKGLLKVKIESEKESALHEFKVDEVKLLKHPKRHEKNDEFFDEEILKNLE